MNTQPIEKKIQSDGLSLDIVGIFPTIQGEGPFTGHRAVFIRLAGCNLQCPGCDTDYTSNREARKIGFIGAEVMALMEPGALVVITGGEPFRQNITPLANGLNDCGYDVQIETNGTLPPSPGLSDNVVVVCSPKAGKINGQMQCRANAFKYVMHADSVAEDGLPILALDHSARPLVARPPIGNTLPVYLQPMDSYNIAQNHRNTKAVLDSCMKHGYILQLQIHKLLGVE